MALSEADLALLARALTLAEAAIGLSDPNPRVGCVIHDAQGCLAGEGHTQQAGGPHAEVMALRAAAAAGRHVVGGTAWVSLEPCAHHGRTPPCADALIAAGLARVVVATTDPFSQVAGQGVARLRAAGITVDLAPPGDIRARAHALNIGFFSRVLRGRPWVRMKLAASLDACTALPDGRSQWITSAAARADGHAWRRRAGAVLTGIGTVLADDPRLDVREQPCVKQPLRVVLDAGFRTPPQAKLLAPPGQCLVIGSDSTAFSRMQALREAGAQVQWVAAGDGAGVDLRPLPALLANQGINELHIEAGARLSGALWRAGWVDELLLYLAPKLIGNGRRLMDLPTLAALGDAPVLEWVEVSKIGPDLRLRLQLPQAQRFLDDWPQTAAH